MAFGPRLIIFFKSILNVRSTKLAGSKYLDAIKYKLEVIQVVEPIKSKQTSNGIKNTAILESDLMINSGFLDGMDNEKAK